MPDATKVIPLLPSEKADKKEMMCGMAAVTKVTPFSPSEKTDKKGMDGDATKVIPFLPLEKTDKKEMDAGCKKRHSLVAVRKDRQKGKGRRM